MKNQMFPKMHVSLNVKDLTETKKFYNTFFNQLPTKEKKDYLKYELSEPPLVISFIDNQQPINEHIGHFGFQVESVEKIKEKLESISDKIEVLKEEKEEYCCYAIQDKFWVTDPSGYKWEVYYFHGDSDKKGEDASCCAPMEKNSTKNELCCDSKENCC